MAPRGALQLVSSLPKASPATPNPAAAFPTIEAYGIAGFVRRQVEDMARYRDMIKYTSRLGECLRAREGKYGADELKAIAEFGGSDVYARLTTNKIRGAAAMMRATFVQGERPWEIKSTPVPTLPDDIMTAIDEAVTGEAKAMQEAGQPATPAAIEKRRESLTDAALDAERETAADEAIKATRYIDDILTEGNFYGALNEFLLDFATLPLGVLRGPTAVMTTKVKYVNKVPTKTRTPLLKYFRIDPYDIMWSPNATTFEDADIIERMRMTRASLQALIGLEGYNEDAIRSVLREYGEQGYSEHEFFDQVRDDMQNQESMLFRGSNIDVLAFSGSVVGTYLLEYGITEAAGEAIDPDFSYLAQVWVCNKYVLKVQIDPDPQERHSYFSASYEPVPGSIMGTALPELMGDVQVTYNAALRALVNNLGMASGPQVAINMERMHEGSDTASIFPWKIWYFNSDPGANAAEKPVEFFQPASNAQELMSVLSFLQALGDEVSAIPRYLTGNEKVGGAGRTASGLSMLMSNATRTMTSIAGAIDANVLGPILQKTYDLIMLTTGATVLRGDESIEPRGATYAEKRETDRMRALELLQITNNPTDLQIIGLDGRAEMIRGVAGTFSDPGRIVPTEDTMRAMQEAAKAQAAMQAAMPQPQLGGGQPGVQQEKAAPQQAAQETDNMHRTQAPPGGGQ